MSPYPIGGLYEADGNPIKALLRPRPGRARYRPLVRAYVGLGANLGDREATIRRAVELVGELDGVAVVGVSSLRETEPWGPVEQPRYLNGAVAVETDLPPRELLEALLDVERRLGRARDDEERWGPRTIDLDLLLYGDLVLDEPGLDVPHPRLHERKFALEPLAELAPDALVPGRGTVAELLRALGTPPQETGPRADAVH
jgi:2-amino-4-hydroxy-6-hydroxymethyldihydropteridine diphosphokinase